MRKNLPGSLLLVCLLCACSSDPPPPAPLQLDYSRLGRIGLNVRRLDIVDRNNAQSPGTMKPTVTDAIRRWAADRLQTAGAAGEATLTIKDASFRIQSLNTATGIDDWFTRQQASKYAARAWVELEARNGGSYATATAEAERSVSLPEDPTPAEQQQAYGVLLDGLMNDLDRNLDRSIRDHMQNFVTAP